MTAPDITARIASQRILAAADEGRLVQGWWHIERKGREFACMLGSIDSDINDASKCPAQVMPVWLAYYVVELFDGQSESDAIAWARRFGRQMGNERWPSIDWERVRVEWAAARAAEEAAASAAASDERAALAAHATSLSDLIDQELTRV